MKAAMINQAGDMPVYGEFPDPQASERQVVITVKAAAISQLVKARAAGTHYSSTAAERFVPGIDGTGYLASGDPVYFLTFDMPWGSMAEKTLVARDGFVPLPATLDPVLAAAIANPGMSSWAALTRRAQLRQGETVLINGATGTSGGLAVRIARCLGAGKIIATGRNRDALEKLRHEGADVTLTLDALSSELPALMAEGVDVVLDYLWGQSALAIMNAAVGRRGEKRAVCADWFAQRPGNSAARQAVALDRADADGKRAGQRFRGRADSLCRRTSAGGGAQRFIHSVPATPAA